MLSLANKQYTYGIRARKTGKEGHVISEKKSNFLGRFAGVVTIQEDSVTSPGLSIQSVAATTFMASARIISLS